MMLPNGREVPDGLDESLIAAIVNRFYARVREDEVLGPVFGRIVPPDGWPAHLATIRDFWSGMLLGTNRYGGRPLPRHAAIPGLSDRHFARWLALFRDTAEAEASPAVAALMVERAERVANSFRMGIAFARGEDTVRMKPIRAGDQPP